jgi:hypothetical protein
MLLLLALALAADDPAPTEATPPAAPPVPVEGAAPGDDEADEVMIIYDRQVERARDALKLRLREEGYKRSERRGEYTVFKNDLPWHPQVWLHDDGWVSLRRQPPRVHSPGYSFADQGSPLNYLWCIPTMMTACVSVGGWTIGDRKYAALKADILEGTREEVRTLNDAVVREHLGQRLYKDIPTDVDTIWRDGTQPAEVRRRMIFLYWDSRVENEAGFAAKEAIRSYVLGVVQPSAEPFTDAELAALNDGRQSEAPLVLKAAP